MESSKIILYIHGMGGGGDSRIPSILKECITGGARPDIEVLVRTYDFDALVARDMIEGWIEELDPCLLVGESLGAVHALYFSEKHGIPSVLVSPALGAPAKFKTLAPLTIIPGVTALLDRKFRPREGDRQRLHFSRHNVLSWRDGVETVSSAVPGPVFAFFGTHDHFMKSGIVSVKAWEGLYGKEMYSMYEGTHFMEEEYVRTILVEKILEFVG